jgi:hypothetical protein
MTDKSKELRKEMIHALRNKGEIIALDKASYAAYLALGVQLLNGGVARIAKITKGYEDGKTE